MMQAKVADSEEEEEIDENVEIVHHNQFAYMFQIKLVAEYYR